VVTCVCVCGCACVCTSRFASSERARARSRVCLCASLRVSRASSLSSPPRPSSPSARGPSLAESLPQTLQFYLCCYYYYYYYYCNLTIFVAANVELAHRSHILFFIFLRFSTYDLIRLIIITDAYYYQNVLSVLSTTHHHHHNRPPGQRKTIPTLLFVKPIKRYGHNIVELSRERRDHNYFIRNINILGT